jgi:hypothetical protein
MVQALLPQGAQGLERESQKVRVEGDSLKGKGKMNRKRTKSINTSFDGL